MHFEPPFTFLLVAHHRRENVFPLLSFIWLNITTSSFVLLKGKKPHHVHTIPERVHKVDEVTFCCLDLFNLRLCSLSLSGRARVFLYVWRASTMQWISFKTSQLTYMKEAGTCVYRCLTLYICPTILSCSTGCGWHFNCHPLYNFFIMLTVNAIKKSMKHACAWSN